MLQKQLSVLNNLGYSHREYCPNKTFNLREEIHIKELYLKLERKFVWRGTADVRRTRPHRVGAVFSFIWNFTLLSSRLCSHTSHKTQHCTHARNKYFRASRTLNSIEALLPMEFSRARKEVCMERECRRPAE